jgi:anti-sigma factor RsiW
VLLPLTPANAGRGRSFHGTNHRVGRCLERATSRIASERAGLVSEAVNDHLRVLSSQHPLDVESGGIHQVKPWFERRLDFAPVLAFEGDAEFPLRGGAVGYFRDRKAAVRPRAAST